MSEIISTATFAFFLNLHDKLLYGSVLDVTDMDYGNNMKLCLSYEEEYYT